MPFGRPVTPYSWCDHHQTIDWFTCSAVVRFPGLAGGAWVFRGSRVPVAALFENLEDDASVHQFFDWFQGVTPEQARSELDHVACSSLAEAQV